MTSNTMRLAGTLGFRDEPWLVGTDWENGDEDWWDAANTATNAPAVWQAAASADPIVVTADEAEQIIAWAETLPGWDEGPEFAPHPLVVYQYDPANQTPRWISPAAQQMIEATA